MSTEAMTQVPLEGLTDEQLFNDANSDEAPAEAVVEAPEASAEQDGQPRDEAGRFAEKPADEPVKAVVETVAEKPAVDDNAAQVPSWRVREINEEKRQLSDRLTALETERNQWLADRQRLQSLEKPPEPAAKPDPLLDPEGYEKYLETKFEEKLLNNHRESSLSQAHRTYKTEFEEAYAAAQKQIDPALKARMQQSRDPGETLIQWHRENKTRAEVGNDPNAYFDKRFEAYLADPANQAKVMERIRGGAQPQPGAPKQASVVSMPPSLTRVAAAVDNTAEDNDISNDGLWRHANA
jgi:hypothetical protein